MTTLAVKPDISTARDMSVTITLDIELLLEAQRQIGAASLDATVGEALRRLVDQERAKRRAAQERLRQMYEEGAFDVDPDKAGGR